MPFIYADKGTRVTRSDGQICDIRNWPLCLQWMCTQNGEDAAEVVILEFGLLSLLRFFFFGTSKTTLTATVITKYQLG